MRPARSDAEEVYNVPGSVGDVKAVVFSGRRPVLDIDSFNAIAEFVANPLKQRVDFGRRAFSDHFDRSVGPIPHRSADS